MNTLLVPVAQLKTGTLIVTENVVGPEVLPMYPALLVLVGLGTLWAVWCRPPAEAVVTSADWAGEAEAADAPTAIGTTRPPAAAAPASDTRRPASWFSTFGVRSSWSLPHPT